MQRIYADNAATTRLSIKAYNAMLPFMLTEYANASQSYTFARNSKHALQDARTKIADIIGASPEEIYFTSGGTESDNWAVLGAIKQKKQIITSSIEHHAIIRPCEYGISMGAKVSYLPVSDSGIVSALELEKLLNKNNSLVSVMLANNEIGTIEPIAQLAKISHKHNAVFHTDAVQALGHTPINVKDLDVDMMSASAHKFNGPKGIGFMYIRKGLDWDPLITGGSQEKNHRAGTENIAAIVAMAVALEENILELDKNIKHLELLENIIIEKLISSQISFLRNGDKNHIMGNMSLSFPNIGGEALLHRLDLLGISVSTGSACNSTDTQISHVLTAIGLNRKKAEGTIRISLGKDNTEEEAAIIAQKIIHILTPYSNVLIHRNNKKNYI